jgi:hypothetical protein
MPNGSGMGMAPVSYAHNPAKNFSEIVTGDDWLWCILSARMDLDLTIPHHVSNYVYKLISTFASSCSV